MLILLSLSFIIAKFNNWHNVCIVLITGSSASDSKQQLSTEAHMANILNTINKYFIELIIGIVTIQLIFIQYSVWTALS